MAGATQLSHLHIQNFCCFGADKLTHVRCLIVKPEKHG